MADEQDIDHDAGTNSSNRYRARGGLSVFTGRILAPADRSREPQAASIGDGNNYRGSYLPRPRAAAYVGDKMSQYDVTSFLRAARRKLWLNAFMQQLRYALWSVSAALLLLALTHFIWDIPGARFAVVAALAVGMIVLLPTLRARPSLGESAQLTDRHFGGQSIITTAHELAGATEPGPAETVVLARANAAVTIWRPKLQSLRKTPDAASFVVAVVPIFVATLVFGLPRSQPESTTTPYSGIGLATGSTAESRVFDYEADLPDLRQAIARNAERARQDESQPENRSPTPGDSAPETTDETQGSTKSDSQSGGFASLATGDGSGPGDARRNPNDPDSGEETAGRQYAAHTLIEIDRHAGVGAGRNGSADEYDAASKTPRFTASNIVPAPAPPGASAWTSLTEAEVSYARKYLSAAGVSNE